MQEELLDDSNSLGEEDYLYLKELEQHTSILTPLAMAFLLYALFDSVAVLRSYFGMENMGFIGYIVFRLLINILLVFIAYNLWKQRAVQKTAHQGNYEQNEEHFLIHTYKTWYLVGFALLIYCLRTVFYIFF